MEFIGLIVLIILILLNAFFVAAEYSLVSARPTKIQELIENGSKPAKRVQSAQNNLNFYIAANQLGITVVALLTGYIAEPAIGALIKGPLESVFGLTSEMVAAAKAITPDTLVVPAEIAATRSTINLIEGISLVFSISVSAILSVIFAELVPKSIAIAQPERLAMSLIRPLEGFAWFFGPISRALEWMGGKITLLFGVKPAEGGKYTAHSEEEIRMIVNASSQQGVLEEGEKELVYNVFDFGDKTVRNIMTPRTKMMAIEADLPLRDLLNEYTQHGYSRIPVYDDSKDNIVGVAYTKDVLQHLEALDHVTIRQIMRPASFVPETMGLRDVVNRLREKKTHLAIVVDEYQGTSGMITLEDVLEQLVGEIYDETDEPEVLPYTRVSDTEYVLDAGMSFEQVEKLLDISVNEDDEDEFDTVAGFINYRFGDIPKSGEATLYDDWEFIVEGADEKSVHRVRAKKLVSAEASEEPPELR
jgi:putative hemolysin